ncbi:glutamate--tRNA ligase [Candidatus Babeliales bacterium]|nr:glutamate--tRNA ligase [Candidatus Babeliales bacterium]
MKNIRVRFAPSPTGHLHIGSARVALFNWLFAQHNNGTYVVRIEDTDTERSTQEYATSVIDALSWLGLESQEPLVVQSTRIDRYKEVITQLLNEGKAYRCFVSEEDIEAYKRARMEHGEPMGYRSPWRDKQPSEQDLQKPYAIRLKVPDDRITVTFVDEIHGEIAVETAQLDDLIIQRSDGMPTYNFVVVIDDHDMEISHVIRGEDHISNTPKQIILYEACGFEVPVFAHVPLILGPSGEKLSKRDAAVSVLDYRRNGYLSDAFCNYLVRLGWSHGDQELFSREQMISYFTLEHVGTKGSIFDEDKLKWFNSIYIKETDAIDLLAIIQRDVRPDFAQCVPRFSQEQQLKLIDIYKPRHATLSEIANEIIELYSPSQVLPKDALVEWATFENVTRLHAVQNLLQEAASFDEESLHHLLKGYCAEYSIKFSLIAQPIRLALTGTPSSPGIYALLSCLGKEESLQRIGNFVTLLQTVT